MVFHVVHAQTRGGHLDATQASFLGAVPRREFFHSFHCWRGLPCGCFSNDVDCEVCDVSFTVADVESAWRGDVWFRQRRLRHKDVTWDILLNGGIYFLVLLRWCIVFLDGLCDSRMFCETSYWALRILRMCWGQKQCGFVHGDVVYELSPPCRGCLPQTLKHVTDMKLFGY